MNLATIAKTFHDLQVGIRAGTFDSKIHSRLSFPLLESGRHTGKSKENRRLTSEFGTTFYTPKTKKCEKRGIFADFLPKPAFTVEDVSKDGARLFITCAAPDSTVCVADLKKGRIVEEIRAGHTAMAPVVRADGKQLFVCNRFNNDVSVIDLRARREVRR